MRCLVAALVLSAAVMSAACGSNDVSREVGARCDTARDCDDRCLPPSNDFPDGLCTLDCQSHGECPEDTFCVDKESGVCLFTCNFDADCRFLGPQWLCKEHNEREDQNRKVLVCAGG